MAHRNTGTVKYQYDVLNQLREERYSNGTTISYDYDSAGNRTNKTVTKYGLTTTTANEYDAANRLKKAGSQVYEVDDNGNLKNDGRCQYVWNAFDQLTEVKIASGTAKEGNHVRPNFHNDCFWHRRHRFFIAAFSFFKE